MQIRQRHDYEEKSSTGRINARAVGRRNRDRASAAQPSAPGFDRAREHDSARSPQRSKSGARIASSQYLALLLILVTNRAGTVASRARVSATTRSWNFAQSRTRASRPTRAEIDYRLATDLQKDSCATVTLLQCPFDLATVTSSSGNESSVIPLTVPTVSHTALVMSQHCTVTV